MQGNTQIEEVWWVAVDKYMKYLRVVGGGSFGLRKGL